MYTFVCYHRAAPRGRCFTPLAYGHLGLQPPAPAGRPATPEDNGQQTLF